MENFPETSGITEIKHDDELLAIVVPGSYSSSGIRFLTPPNLTQQLGYMAHPAGHDIVPHCHNAVERVVRYTQEVLIIRKGNLRVDFYLSDKTYLKSHVLQAGDIIVLVSGGHGFHVLQDVEMFEIKQGPYAGESDKTRFRSITEHEVRFSDSSK